MLEDKIVSLGGKYERADLWAVSVQLPFRRDILEIDTCWQAKVIVDGNLITGQNPASAFPIGEAILKALQK